MAERFTIKRWTPLRPRGDKLKNVIIHFNMVGNPKRERTQIQLNDFERRPEGIQVKRCLNKLSGQRATAFLSYNPNDPSWISYP